MINANHPFTSPLLVAIIIIPTLMGCSKLTASVNPTTFKCIQNGNSWATFAQKGNQVSDIPLLSWNTTEFGGNFTPEKRCQIVSDKLTQTVIQNGGKLGELSLTYGPVGKLTVICFVPQQQGSCNDNNMLFTLNQNNAQNPSQVLADITGFAKGEKKTIAEGGLPQYILLENLVDKSFKNKSVW